MIEFTIRIISVTLINPSLLKSAKQRASPGYISDKIQSTITTKSTTFIAPSPFESPVAPSPLHTPQASTSGGVQH